jgi:uncharacterized protein (DUF3820 family)
MTETLATALIAAQKEMPAVEKTAKAVYGMYATLDHIIAKTRPVLNKHGLSIVQFPVVTDQGAPGLKTSILHSSGESVSAVTPLFLPKQDMQALGSAITYARRYAWAAALGISAEADDDGAYATQNPVAEPKAVEKKPPLAAPVSQAEHDEPASATGNNYQPPPEVQQALNARASSSVPAPEGYDGSPESMVVTIGTKHKGKRLDAVPRSYLEWLASEAFTPQTKDTRLLKNCAVAILNDVPVPAGGVDADPDIPFMWTWA